MALLEIKDLHTYFKTKRGTVKAVNGVSYSVEPGKTLGLVGESGCGKSVSAMSILRLLDGNGYIERGEIWFNGQDLTKISINDMYKIRGNEISVIFQEPMTSLNPVFTVEKQISESFIVHQNMSKRQAAKEAVRMLADVQIPNPEDVVKQYPHQLSGGMRQRVMIAMALACRPSLLIADEPTTALDVTIQAQILKLMNDLKREKGTSILFITHDLGVINQMADDVAVMYSGQIVEMAPVRTIFTPSEYSHPYTEGLMLSIPRLETKRNEKLEAIGPGSHPLTSRRDASLRRGANTPPSAAEPRSRNWSMYPIHSRSAVFIHQGGATAWKIKGIAPDPQPETVFSAEKQAYCQGERRHNLDIYEGETLGLVGESGCGKSTLGRTLCSYTDKQTERQCTTGDRSITLPPSMYAGRLKTCPSCTGR